MKALIMACLDRETPEYLQVAGKLYMADLYKRVFKSDTPFTLKDHIKKMQDLDYYRTWDYTEEEINIIDSYLDHKSDFNTSYTSIKQFETKYFVKDVSLGQTYETPQFLYARIAMTILEKEENRLEKIKEYLALLRSKKLSLPSPNWEYIGTKKGMATSCCLYTCEDTSSSITALNLITDIMNTQSAGLGYNMQIRTKGDGARNNRLEHNGKLPYLTAQQALAKSNKQGSRGGAITQYFVFFDPEVKALIKARNPTTLVDERVDQIDHAILHNSLLAELTAKGEDLCLFSIKDVPDLYKAFYNKDPIVFRTLYAKYSKTSFVKSKVKAREVSLLFNSEAYETGRLYDINIEEANRHTPSQEPIHSSNLCTEILEATAAFHSVRELFQRYSSEYTYVDTLEQRDQIVLKEFNTPVKLLNSNAIKLPRHLTEGDVFEFEDKVFTVKNITRKNEIALCNIAAINLNGDFTDEQYFKTAYYALLTILWVIDNSEYPFENLEYTSKARRNAAVGLTGLAYELARNNLYYSSVGGKKHMHFIAERHFYMLCKAGIQLAKEKGVPVWFDRSNYSKGWLPIDTYNKNVDTIADFTYEYDWEELRKELLEYGLAFSFLVAHMPCESSSQVLENTNGLYPCRDLVVIKGDGAHKNIFIVPEYHKLKDQYEIAWEVGYNHMIDCYAIFQKWADQGISADFYEDFTSPWQEPLTDKLVLTRYLRKVKMGVKGTYYTNSKTRKTNESSTQEVGCGSGGCSL